LLEGGGSTLLWIVAFIVQTSVSLNREHRSTHLRRFGNFAALSVSMRSKAERILARLTLRRLMSYIYGAPILDVSRSHTTTQHSR